MRITRRRLLYFAILLLAPLLTAALLLPTYPLRETDGEEAARLITAWALAGTPLPGSPVVFGETRQLADAKKIVLVCDWVPRYKELSDNPRVERANTREGEERLESKGLWRTTYLVIHLKRASDFFLLVEVTPGVEFTERRSYEVTIRRRLWGLEARVRVVTVP